MKAYEFIEHTADIGVVVYGRDMISLFRHAAMAMFEVISSPRETPFEFHPKSFKVELHSDNQEDLLIAWLNELNYLSETQDVIGTVFEISHISHRDLSACLKGYPRGEFSILTEIKAVTYHGLELLKTDEGFSVQIIFDV